MRLGRCLIARLDHGMDIVDQITDLAKNEKIAVGSFSAIGALMQAEFAFYDQVSHEYQKISIDKPVELVSCSGNISIRDNQPFVHAHASLADSAGQLWGGHLVGGKVFAAELCIQEMLGETLIRKFDSVTGLYLWDKK
ncbi:MAG: PPC domain-containing DNA-binding protein [Methanotrichaceae archaeon]